MLFADVLSLHLVTFLMFFILVHVTFFSSRCMLELKFAITEQQVSPHRLPTQYWLKNLRLSSITPSTPTVFLFQQSYVIITYYISLLSDLCACVHVKKKWRRKGSHSSSVSGSNRLVDFKLGKKAMGWCTTQ